MLQALRMDRFGLIGLALLLASSIGYATLVAPRLAERDALEARLKEAPAAGLVTAAGEGDVEARLAAFQRALPATASVPQWLGSIRTAVVQSGLSLSSVTYKLERTADSPILRYRITLPVSGSYSQVRNFIGTVLTDVPAASVDDVQLKREDGSPRTLEARIRLTLFIAAE